MDNNLMQQTGKNGLIVDSGECVTACDDVVIVSEQRPRTTLTAHKVRRRVAQMAKAEGRVMLVQVGRVLDALTHTAQSERFALLRITENEEGVQVLEMANLAKGEHDGRYAALSEATVNNGHVIFWRPFGYATEETVAARSSQDVPPDEEPHTGHLWDELLSRIDTYKEQRDANK